MNHLKNNQLRPKNSAILNPPIEKSEDSVYPKLSLEFLRIKENTLQKVEKLNVFNNICKILSFSWREISLMKKDGIGYELLNLSQLKCSYPKIELFRNINKVTVFHKDRSDIPLIGFRVDDIYYLFCIDRSFTAYNH